MSYKRHIINAMNQLYNNKFISIRDGNVSFKPKNEKYFYISAGSIKKNIINEDQVVKIDFKKYYEGQTNLIYDKDYKYQPSRELFMHSFLQTHDIFKNKDTFVVHAHPPNIISYVGLKYSNQLNNIKDKFPEINVGKIGENVPYFDAGSNDLAENSFNKLIGNDIVALEKHGTLSIGDDIDKILEDIETLEYYINIAIKSEH
tara:strand:- start:102 stop:707 length:606 start_codon:yes stop_codon:yes gene_type:complete